MGQGAGMVGPEGARHHRAQIIEQGIRRAPLLKWCSPRHQTQMGTRTMLMGVPIPTTKQLNAVLQHCLQLEIHRPRAREQGETLWKWAGKGLQAARPWMDHSHC